LMTTHIPLHAVPKTITKQLIHEVITIIDQGLKKDFGIAKPIIRVAGLNPHAGESGYLGREEIEVIAPALEELRNQGLNIEGPLSADTMFVNQDNSTAVFVAMYHDQGLPVIKYAGFSDAVNITLGLPIIRTSVDHGTALALAGSGKANPGSLMAAITLASELVINRENYNDQNQSHCSD
jgi:4-hydroxythreonine-4-phosphate dehydrogenase